MMYRSNDLVDDFVVTAELRRRIVGVGDLPTLLEALRLECAKPAIANQDKARGLKAIRRRRMVIVSLTQAIRTALRARVKRVVGSDGMVDGLFLGDADVDATLATIREIFRDVV